VHEQNSLKKETDRSTSYISTT